MVLKKAVEKEIRTAVLMFEFLRNLVPAFYVKWTDQKKWTDPIETCTAHFIQKMYFIQYGNFKVS